MVKMLSRTVPQTIGSWFCKSSRQFLQLHGSTNYVARSMSQRVDRLRFMQKLKEDESVCQKFISEGYFAVFCNLKPLIGEAGVLWKSYSGNHKGEETLIFLG